MQKQAAWKAANPDRKRELDRLCYERNGERVRARSAAWRKANPELARAAVADWVEEHRDRKLANDRAYYAEHAEQNKARRAAYHQANREKSQAASARRKARKLGNRCERVSYVDILAEHGMTCHICSSEITDRSDLHFDHVIPLALGGAHANDNIRPSHARCNLSKGARLLAG